MKFCEWLKESREKEARARAVEILPLKIIGYDHIEKNGVLYLTPNKKPIPSHATFYPPIDEKEKTHG